MPLLPSLNTKRRFFKLICGGSFNDLQAIEGLCTIYTLAGADCIDLAPQPTVLQAALQGLQKAQQLDPTVVPPTLMISLPLDPDPHFQKIALSADLCTGCNACLPTCPTVAMEGAVLPDKPLIEIDQPRCYGCGRCLPACPTDALSLLPFINETEAQSVLTHPQVTAVEIHTRYADPEMFKAFYTQWQALLLNKTLSICLSPSLIPMPQVLLFLEQVHNFLENAGAEAFILQVDGEPMSGTASPNSSHTAFTQAQTLLQAGEEHYGPGFQNWFQGITLSGGVNAHTAELLRSGKPDFIAGVGMGTMAREQVWGILQALPPADDPNTLLLQAAEQAKQLVSPYH